MKIRGILMPAKEKLLMMTAETELKINSAIQEAIKGILSNPMPHGIFKLEIHFRDFRATRFVTTTERSFLLENSKAG